MFLITYGFLLERENLVRKVALGEVDKKRKMIFDYIDLLPTKSLKPWLHLQNRSLILLEG
jgi:hypothetical protein